MRVSELAKSLAVTSDTVRYYTRIGMLFPIKDRDNGYHNYNARDQHRLRFILSARQLGFSVQDIELILREADKGKAPCPVVRQLLERRLDQAGRRFNDVEQLRDRMSAAIVEWRSKPDRLPTGQMICHLIEEFEFDG